MKYKFLSFSWKDEFIDIISRTKEELFLSSPFINIEGIKILSNCFQKKSSINISLLTNLTSQNIINRSTEPTALLGLYKLFDQVRISSLGKLHAKVYIVDNEIGIITSANLTSGGLINNFEYGVFIDDKNVISTIKEDMTDNSIKNTRVAQLLKKATETIDFELLKSRIREGKTINAIFSDTVLYVLK